MSTIITVVISATLVILLLIALVLLMQRRRKEGRNVVDTDSEDWRRQIRSPAPPPSANPGTQQQETWGPQGVAQRDQQPWPAPQQQSRSQDWPNRSIPDPWATRQEAEGQQPEEKERQWQQSADNASPAQAAPYSWDAASGGFMGTSALPPAPGRAGYGSKDIRDALKSGQKEQDAVARDLTHEHLQFTAFYPGIVPVAAWNTLLVYAHVQAARQAVHEDAQKFKEEIGPSVDEASVWSILPMARGTQITIEPTCQGIRFNPERVVFTWIENWHQIKFRFRVDQKQVNTIGNGEITVYAGPLIIGSIKISMRFIQQGLSPHVEERKNVVEASAYLYKRIFTSYSHKDTAVVIACRNAYRALGFESFIDIDTLRSGQRWNTELMRMIDKADLFQLFWSADAAQSADVRQEWQYALQRSSEEGFIRPVFWERPLPSPPTELQHLHFAYVELPRLESLEETQKLPPRSMLPDRVRVERGKEPGRIYEIRTNTFSIGRSREGDLFLEDLRVSRLHISILKTKEGEFMLRDEGSANGTKLNGQTINKLQMFPLNEGDKIQIGETELVFLKGNGS